MLPYPRGIVLCHHVMCMITQLNYASNYSWSGTLRTGCNNQINFNAFLHKYLTFQWLFGNIWPSCFRNNSNFWKKNCGVMRERNNWPLRTQYMDTWYDGTFDVNMTSSKVVRTRHHIRRFLSLILNIKLNTGQTLGTTDRRERRKNMAKSEGPNSDCNIEIFSKSEKSHNWGQTWHIFCLSQIRSKLHYPIILSVK